MHRVWTTWGKVFTVILFMQVKDYFLALEPVD
ncbi:hypothetical protein SKPI104516_08165 [Skermania piniformis]